MELFVTFLAGFSIAVGAIFVKYAKNPDRLSHWSLALALGAMVALVLSDLGPESLELADEKGPVYMLLLAAAGVAVLAAIEHFIPDHDESEAESHHHSKESVAIHVGLITVAALALHNIVEGMTMYALMLDDFSAGATYAFGVALHNVPMGMLIFSTLRKERRRDKVVAISFALFSTVLGGVIMMLLSPLMTETIMEMLTCLALGMILYIVVVELIPHAVHRRPVWVSAVGIAVGFALVRVATLLG